MQASHQILEEYFKCLWKTQHGFVVDAEGGNLLSMEVYNLASIGSGIIRADHLERLVSVVVKVSHGGTKEKV